MTSLLQVEDLRVSFATRDGTVEALRNIGFSLQAGQTLGLVGESGSGKSVTSMAIMRVLDRAARITGGRILFQGQDITRAATAATCSDIRGAPDLHGVPESARRAEPDPQGRAPDRGCAAARIAAGDGAGMRAAKAIEVLLQVRADRRMPEERLSMPTRSELSGGMCQRIDHCPRVGLLGRN